MHGDESDVHSAPFHTDYCEGNKKSSSYILKTTHNLCHVVLIHSYTISSSCTVTNDVKIFLACGRKIKHTANIFCMRHAGNLISQA